MVGKQCLPNILHRLTHTHFNHVISFAWLFIERMSAPARRTFMVHTHITSHRLSAPARIIQSCFHLLLMYSVIKCVYTGSSAQLHQHTFNEIDWWFVSVSLVLSLWVGSFFLSAFFSSTLQFFFSSKKMN